MDDSTFHSESDDALQRLYDAVVDADEQGSVDAKLQEGVLTIELDNGQKYVINKHAALHQVWMASPVSGTSHFDWDVVSAIWMLKDGETLDEKVATELEGLAGLDLDL